MVPIPGTSTPVKKGHLVEQMAMKIGSRLEISLVSELQPNQVVTATFLVQHKEIRQKKTGEPYLSLTSGIVQAKLMPDVGQRR